MQIEMDKLMELGARLKERRRKLGLEREEVAIKIKISAKALHALEEAIPDSLPQLVFAKGFARSYAEALSLDMTEMNALIDEAFPVEFTHNVNPELSSAAREQSISINHSSNGKLMLVVLPLLLLVIGLGGWFVYNKFIKDMNVALPIGQSPAQSRQAAQPAPPPVAPPAPPVADNSSSAAAAEGAAAQTPAPPAPAEPDVAEVQDPPAPPVQTPPPLTLAPNQVPQSNARADSPIPGGMHRIVIFAKYECWVGADFDGSGRRAFTLEPGQTFVLDFKSLRLTLGNAGGVEMSFDGKPYNTGGRPGDTRVLSLPAQ